MSWILIEDEAPPEGETLLLWSKKKGVEVGDLEVGPKGNPYAYIFLEDAGYNLNLYSHWMSLPRGPDEEE